MMAPAIASRGGSSTAQMKRLDSGFKCDAQETRGLWIEPLPIEVLSDRHMVENSSEPLAKNMVQRELLLVGYPTKNPNYPCIFSYGRIAIERRQRRAVCNREG